MHSKPCNALLVSPRFDFPSFWSLHTTSRIAGRRHMEPPLGLITVAGLLPAHWQLRLIDRNIEELTEQDLDWADLVMTGGMIPQRPDTLRLIDLCHTHRTPVVVGGPDVTSSPHVYSHADFKVLGEAEGAIRDLIRAWSSGRKRGLFEAEKYKVDVGTSPTPRFDLLNTGRYLAVSVQFSRGCPFTCEFCDIIELYGRVPRTKTVEQMLSELEALYELGYRGHVDFVDDNLIGNKKAVKNFLPHLCEWQKQRRYPFTFSTQASINLADDDKLLRLMREANFGAVFIGIESPDADTLISMQKKQNTRRNLAQCIQKIYQAGMFVTAGFIVGFDSEKRSVAGEMIACIEEASLPICMIGMLAALPNTQLSRRLAREGRLDPQQDFMFEDMKSGDQSTLGLNFDTARPRRDILNDYKIILEQVYQPALFFARARTVGRLLAPPRLRVRISLRVLTNDLFTMGRLAWWLSVRQPRLWKHFAKTIFDCAVHNPRALKQVMSLMLIYLHAGPFSRDVIAFLEEQIAKIDSGELVSRDCVFTSHTLATVGPAKAAGGATAGLR